MIFEKALPFTPLTDVIPETSPLPADGAQINLEMRVCRHLSAKSSPKELTTTLLIGRGQARVGSQV